jgi:metal-responsive CopG/Arc/MetJ family transcriptional regulator
MKSKMAQRKTIKTQTSSLVRASISFPPNLYATLDGLAKQKKVSLAWVVRDAAERYVAEEAARTAGPHSDQRRRHTSR